MAQAKKHMGVGILLAISFFVVLFLMFSPIFPETKDGKPQNGLQWADEMFNELAKGSSYFIPKVQKDNEKFMGKMISVSIDFDNPEAVENAAGLFTTAGAQIEVQGTELKITADLGKTMTAVLNDADAMYHNEGAKVSSLYGYNEKEVLKNWHTALARLDKELKKGKMVEEAKLVSDVMKKTVETAYNFYQVDAVQVKDKAGLMTGLLVFYVAYTMWWGFAIFYIFEGIGLSMKKAKVKKEV